MYAKALFESTGEPARQNTKGGISGSWWVEKALPGTDTGGKKKYLFKPIDTEGHCDGMPTRGGAGREVLSKSVGDHLQAVTGIDFGLPEAHLVAIDKTCLTNFNDPEPNQPLTL